MVCDNGSVALTISMQFRILRSMILFDLPRFCWLLSQMSRIDAVGADGDKQFRLFHLYLTGRIGAVKLSTGLRTPLPPRINT